MPGNNIAVHGAGGVRCTTDSNLLEAVYTMNDFVLGEEHLPGINRLRTPLHTIFGFGQLLLDPRFGSLSETQQGYAELILESSRQLLGAVNDVTELAGLEIDPLIRDSHAFAVCLVDPTDRLLLRKFCAKRTPDDRGDPFLSFEVDRLVTGSPILKRAAMAIDCEVVRHVDLEADHELFVGEVVAGRVYRS